MRIVKPYHRIRQFPTVEIMKVVEEVGRNCYQSQDRITEDSWRKFVRSRVDEGDGIVEHAVITAQIVTDRATADCLMRHRIASFATESTRYCNYSRGKFGQEIAVCQPWWVGTDLEKEGEYDRWVHDQNDAENSYISALERGWTAERARTHLPLALKTSCYCTMNMKQWRYVGTKRTRASDDLAHPDMVAVMRPLFQEFAERLPEVFGDCTPWQERLKLSISATEC